MPVLRPADRPRGPALASTRTSSASLYSPASAAPGAGRVVVDDQQRLQGRPATARRTEATAARMSSQRSSV